MVLVLHNRTTQPMGENIKSRSCLRKSPEILVYAVYIECQTPFNICYFSYFSMGVDGGMNLAVSDMASEEENMYL